MHGALEGGLTKILMHYTVKNPSVDRVMTARTQFLSNVGKLALKVGSALDTEAVKKRSKRLDRLLSVTSSSASTEKIDHTCRDLDKVLENVIEFLKYYNTLTYHPMIDHVLGRL